MHGLRIMTRRAASHRSGFHALGGELDMAIATEAMEISFDHRPNHGIRFVAGVTRGLARVVQKIVMTCGASGCRMIVMIEIHRQQRSGQNGALARLPQARTGKGRRQHKQDYRQGSTAHGEALASGGAQRGITTP